MLVGRDVRFRCSMLLTLCMSVEGSAGQQAAGPQAAGPQAAGRQAAEHQAADARWLARAIELAVANVANGGGPFGSVLVRDGVVVAEGQNRVTATLDPTAHAEVVAIRAACQVIGDFSLPGATLYTSCEPCPLCLSAALWARVDRVVYAADRDDAARGGFDDREFYELFAKPREEWHITIDSLRLEDSPAPFEAWLARDHRTGY
jgi:guanine deaminase